MSDETDLTNRVVVITGAARGMGRAHVEAFLAHGARVAGLDRAWDTPPSGVLALTGEVTRPTDIAAACQATLEAFGRVDVLVNNAAMRQRDLYPPHGAAAVLDTSGEDWQRMFDVNVFGVLNVIRAFVRQMLEQRRGSIINISSGGSVGRAHADEPGVWLGRNPGVPQPTVRRVEGRAHEHELLSRRGAQAEQHRRQRRLSRGHAHDGLRRNGGRARTASASTSRHWRRPEHVVPLVLHLAKQAGDGETGQAYDAIQWNARHGFGTVEEWRA